MIDLKARKTDKKYNIKYYNVHMLCKMVFTIDILVIVKQGMIFINFYHIFLFPEELFK